MTEAVTYKERRRRLPYLPGGWGFARTMAACALLLCLTAGGCRGNAAQPDGPAAALVAFIEAARNHDRSRASQSLTSGTISALDEFQKSARAIDATNVPDDVLLAILDSFASERPKILESQVSEDKGTCTVLWRSGHRGTLDFIRQDGLWKIDLEASVRPSIKLLQDAKKRLEAIPAPFPQPGVTASPPQ